MDYGNAGVMLLHVERMRRTHAEFIRFIFSDEVVEAGMDHGVGKPFAVPGVTLPFASAFCMVGSHARLGGSRRMKSPPWLTPMTL